MNRTIQSSVQLIKNQTVRLKTDNKNVTSIIRNGSRKPDLPNIACELNSICSENNIKLFSQWIPRKQNKIADNLSRYADCDDWGICESLFRFLDNEFGRHTIDRFATDYNNKCIRFNTTYWCKGKEAIDAFSQFWGGENNWLVPPPNLVCKVIRKCCDDKAMGTLVVPMWKSAPYWVLLHEMHGGLKSFVAYKKHLTNDKIIVPGRGNNGVFEKPLLFSFVAFKIRFI